MINLKTLKDIDVTGKTVLYRSPYDIGVKDLGNGVYAVKDDSRIRATIPTIKYLQDKNCKIVVLTYVERPEGKIVEKYRTTPHAKKLSELLGQEVIKIDECVGEEVRNKISTLNPKEILMLENTRFHPEEDLDDDNFAQELAKNGEVVVFDGFPQAHRAHASTTGILRHLPAVAGLYMEKEVAELGKLIENPEHPFTLIIGGAKVSDKVDAINNLISKTDHILVGGGTANVFLKALGKEMGASFMEDKFVDANRKEKKDWVEYAKEIMQNNPGKVITPIDAFVASDGKNPGEITLHEVTDNVEFVPNGLKALDIGPKTVELYTKVINSSKMVFWNGPMGMFEEKGFSQGTAGVAKAMETTSQATTIVCGGDTVEAALKFADTSKLTHLSLAGGASLEFLSGKELPVLKMLQK